MLHRLRALNEIAVSRTAIILSTIWCVDAFAFLSIVPLLLAPGTFNIFYLSSGILQLVALPVLAYMSGVIQRQGDAAQALALRLQQETHDMVKAELADIALDLAADEALEDLMTRLCTSEETILAALTNHTTTLQGTLTKDRKR